VLIDQLGVGTTSPVPLEASRPKTRTSDEGYCKRPPS